MHHAEARKVSVWEIARIGIRSNIQEIRSKFDHSKRSSYSRKVVTAILSPSAIEISKSSDIAYTKPLTRHSHTGCNRQSEQLSLAQTNALGEMGLTSRNTALGNSIETNR
jgi:hypothetical protein